MTAKPTTGDFTRQLTNSAVEYRNIEAEIAKLFTDVLNVDVPLATTDLLDTGILESGKFVELLICMEQKFDVQIDLDDMEIENFRCIERIANLVLKRRTSSNAAAS